MNQTLQKARKIYTQRELASILEYSARQISRWEKGDQIPKVVVKVLRDVVASYSTEAASADAFTFIDLFAGIGGIRLGFESGGGQCVFTSEWDEFAQKTYRANFGDSHEIAGDITKIEARDIPDHDVLLAGFPCQPFSIAGVSKKNSLGKPHGFECTTQGTLFFDVARIIAEKRPKAFLLENVKNLISHDKGQTFKVILDTLERELGYHVSYEIFDARHFVPQHRERVIIVGFRERTPFDLKALRSSFSRSERPVLRSILHPENRTEIDVDDLRFIDVDGNVQKKFTLTDNLWRYLQQYAEKHRAKGNGFGYSLVGPADVSRTLSARYYKDGSEILIDRGSHKNPRRLTPRECARLMGYPESFRIVSSDTRAYKQFGNSVVVPLMQSVAKSMKPYILDLKTDHMSAGAQGSIFYG